MPRPVEKSAAYRPALDGLRAVAVAGVVAYHLGASWAPGGLLGVGVFFTLSGFLITGILLRSWSESRSMRLGDFWLRRARRLMPALIVVLVATLTMTAIVAPGDGPKRLRESAAGLLYVANWDTIAAGDSYFDRFAGPGPLDHLWSLAIEEQFYLVWPLVLLAFLAMFRGRLKWVALATTGLAAASFAAMWLLANPGFDHTRVYEGTDTRAGGLLVGAVLAMGIHALSKRAPLRRRAPEWLDLAALGGLGLISWMTVSVDTFSMTLYTWGFAALSVATAVVVAAGAHREGVVTWLLGLAPLRWLGERSYGIYLWHLPVIAFLPTTLGAAWHAGVAVTLTLALAAASWTFIEDPIRRHGFVTWLSVGAVHLRRAANRAGGWVTPTGSVRRRAIAATSIAAVTIVATTGTAVALTVRVERASSVDSTAAAVEVEVAPPPAPTAAPTTTPVVAPKNEAEAIAARQKVNVTPHAIPGNTSCERVVHVGDSTSLGLVGEGTPTDKQVASQYSRVGVAKTITDVRGARSIVERYKGEPNAQDAVQSRLDKGYNGCWVIAMGINEAANQAVGGSYPFDERIDRILSLTGNQPVMWVNAITERTDGPYADSGMKDFNKALVAACERYPQLRVYDWRSEAKPAWFQQDGIHYTTAGYIERGARIAGALASAFPDGEPAVPRCVVSSR